MRYLDVYYLVSKKNKCLFMRIVAMGLIDEFLVKLAIIIFGVSILVFVIKWLWTAPGEFFRLLKAGPNPKLTFVFIGMALSVLSLHLARDHSDCVGIPVPNNFTYTLAVILSIGLTALAYRVFLDANFPKVGYFFIIILKVLLTIIPAFAIIYLRDNFIWGLTYFVIMFIVSYYSYNSIRTKVRDGTITQTTSQTSNNGGFKINKTLKYLLSSLFQAILGAVVSMILSLCFA